MTSFNVNDLFPEPISKCSHIQSVLGSYENLGELNPGCNIRVGLIEDMRCKDQRG